jgi:hypothetical protein
MAAAFAAALLSGSCGSSREAANGRGGPGTFGDGGASAFVDAASDPSCPECGEVTTCEMAKADKSAMGCEFYSVVPDSPTVTRGSCYAAFLVNTANTTVQIQVERGVRT